MNQRNTSIDTAKGLSIIFVVIIHSLSALYSHTGEQTTVGLVDRLIHHITHIAVPMFIGVSGFVLAQSFQRKPQPYLSFLKKRLSSILPLYLLWTVAFQGFFRFNPHWANYYQDKPWWFVLILGGGDYHLYFVPLIISLYIIFPLLYNALLKFPFIILSLGAIIQGMISFYITANPSTPYIYVDQFIYRVPFSWIWYFVFGMAVSMYPAVFRKVTRTPAIIMLLIGLILTVMQGEYLISLGRDGIVATMATRVPLMLFATGALLAVFNTTCTNTSILTKLGEYSYIIFLSHTMPIWLAQVYLRTGTLPAVSLFVFVGTLLLSFIWIRKSEVRRPVQFDTNQK